MTGNEYCKKYIAFVCEGMGEWDIQYNFVIHYCALSNFVPKQVTV